MGQCVAVLDVGKTNKKIAIFDEAMHQLEVAYAEFPADESKPEHREQTEATAHWFLDQLRLFAGSFDIGMIGVTTHGATFAYVDAQGELSTPTPAYTTDPGPEFADDAFKLLGGDARSLHREFATPYLGKLVNAGLGALYVRKQHPKAWENTRWILPYPQYFAFLLTGQPSAEPTMLGCHTYLYDFHNGAYSRAVDAFGIREKLPTPIQNSGAVLGTISPAIAKRTGLAPHTRVILGVHDSNASLVPYLMHARGPFILNSTGTWCVTMRPAEAVTLTDAQRDLGVFHNCSVFGNPVKTAVFMGGQERLSWLAALESQQPGWKAPDYSPALTRNLIERAETFILPGVMPGSGPFPSSTSRLLHEGKSITLDAIQGEAFPLNDLHLGYTAVCVSLAIQTAELLRNLDLEPGMQIFIEGGFRHNKIYQNVLSALCPTAEIVLSSLKEATAFGAGLLALAALKGQPLESLRDTIAIETAAVEPEQFSGLESYRNRWIQHALAAAR